MNFFPHISILLHLLHFCTFRFGDNLFISHNQTGVPVSIIEAVEMYNLTQTLEPVYDLLDTYVDMIIEARDMLEDVDR